MEAFESTLKEVVHGKRVSQSKMTKLTEIAMQNMENDTQLVSILYRTHKSLPVAAKVSSLYAFDALCRAARSHATKQGLTGDIHAEKGNSATFLLKVEGVLDGLVKDMISSEGSDAKEKTKKILDIWTKASTFSPAVLSRLSDLAAKAEKGKETKKSPTATSDPRVQQHTPPGVTTPPVPVTPTAESAQATLLALLSGAAAAAAGSANGQTPANIGNPALVTASQPQLEPLQLALLQQLANKAHLGSVTPVQTVPVPVPVVPQYAPPNAGANNMRIASSSPPRKQHPNSDRRDPRFNSRHDEYSERNQGRDDYHDDRREYRGGRGGFRGRGRDDFKGRFGDRERFRDRDEEWGSAKRLRSRSRSRSPPHGRFAGGRRDVKTYSPPRRPTMPQHPHASSPGRLAPPEAAETGKDEFGRDIRPASPEPDKIGAANDNGELHTIAAPTEQKQEPTAEPSTSTASISEVTPVAAGSKSSAASTTSGGGGLESFDIATFDFTNPASWVALGEAFKVTHGYLPSQEELMMLISGGAMMMGTGVPAPQPMDEDTQWGGQSWGGPSHSQVGRGGYRGGRGRGRGWMSRGGYGSGSSQTEHGEWGYAGNSYGQESEAIVLGGDTSDVGKTNMEVESAISGPSEQNMQTEIEKPTSTGGGPGGQMRKVGDRWIFVKKGAMTA
ncbi:hypothetical protein BD410DRAFT_763959 [Rickenella mellea]|uniref:CID domain-containing protein n=1 Tax=Rickenella mellea TaxID=50990 RepID=A0A4Y7QG58_9AGAM|nr:hypothetical protein BD410DRAFT_763959 [Rickenella mellea]